MRRSWLELQVIHQLQKQFHWTNPPWPSGSPDATEPMAFHLARGLVWRYEGMFLHGTGVVGKKPTTRDDAEEDVPLGSMVRISGLQPQYTPFISRWNNPYTNHWS